MRIMIDAGHGYTTPGKRSVDGMREYEFNRSVAIEMEKLLASFEGVTISFSHSDERDVPLSERTNKANQEKVDLFVSIHANAHGNGKEWTSAEGIETYVYTSRPKAALGLATKVQEALVQQTGRKDRGVKAASFHVLKATQMTAILCECGFMTNQTEAKLLRTAHYQKICAKAIVEGIAAYYKLKQKHADNNLYKVQLGAFSHKQHAENLQKELESKGYKAIIVTNKK